MKKTAIVTGGAGGIGFGTAQQLAADGFNIVIFDIKDEYTVSDKIAQLDATGSDTMYFRGNIANVGDCFAFVEKVIEKYRKIDVLVNNSGVAPKIPVTSCVWRWTRVRRPMATGARATARPGTPVRTRRAESGD